MRTHRFIIVVCTTLLGVACHRKDDAAATTRTTSATTAATTAVTSTAGPTKAGTKDVDLAPLPLKITMAASEEAMTMDKSLLGTKSVGVSCEAINAGLNVSEPHEKSFDAVKKSAKADKVLFPFKKWVRETPTSAIEEFVESGKTGYIAWSWKVVGGKPYLCQSAGLSGLKTVDDAEKALKLCDTLATR